MLNLSISKLSCENYLFEDDHLLSGIWIHALQNTEEGDDSFEGVG